MRWWVVLLAALTVVPAGAQQQNAYLTGNDFWRTCARPVYDFETIGCQAYVRGIADMLAFQPGIEKTLCVPRTVTAKQLYDLLLKELGDRPEDRHHYTAGIFTALLWTKFPCQ